MSFQDALAETEGTDRALLIGNGFSAQHFSYATLLNESGLGEGTPLRNLFAALDTADFEAVVRALEDASIVERAYGNGGHAEELTLHAQQVREALVQAVRATHPAHREDLELDACVDFLEKFGTIFSLNYDLLLYWVTLGSGRFRDGFGLGANNPTGTFRKPFSESAYCEIYNLHGGLHLFQDADGEVMKALNAGEGVIATISKTILDNKRLPLYVAEGTSLAKVRKINSVEYLRYCFRKLMENTASVFIFGHSAAQNDAHIYHAIFGSDAQRVFFGVYQPDEEKLLNFDGQMAKYQKIGGNRVEYKFYDSVSANVWEGGAGAQVAQP